VRRTQHGAYHPVHKKDDTLHVFEDGWQRGIRVESNTGLYKHLGMNPVEGTVGNPNSGNPYVYANDLPNMLVNPTGRDGINYNKQFLKACILGAVGGDVTLIVAVVAATSLTLPFAPMTLLTLGSAALAGCFGGAIIAFASDILDAVVGS